MMVKESVKESVRKIKKLVNSFNGIVPAVDLQNVLAELRTIEGYFQVKRIHFPKRFSVKFSEAFVSLEEQTPSQTTFCTDSQYDSVAKNVAAMQTRGENFNRFTLLEEIHKTDPRVTMPAVLVCLHYWLSMSDPLLLKKEALFTIDSYANEFQSYAAEAWDDVRETPLKVAR